MLSSLLSFFWVVLFIGAVLAVIHVYGKVKFNQAVRLVAQEIVLVLPGVEKVAPVDRCAFSNQYVREGVLTGAGVWNVQHALDLTLQRYWAMFQMDCKSQNQQREELKRRAKEEPRSMTEDQVKNLCSLMNHIDSDVEDNKKYFWDLWNAAKRIGLRTWKQGDFYALLKSEEAA